VTDAESGRHVGDVAMGKGAAGIGFDPERKLIFTSNADDGTLTIIHEDDPDRYSVVDTLATQTGAGPLALDPRTHRIYLVATTGAQLMVVGN
jgi:DNA-binding beta-propeller fold protein YncE